MGGSVGSEDGDMGFQIAPMVDVVFVLLLFFMASAGSRVVEKELSINLPASSTPDPNKAPSTPIVIDIAPDGQVTMNSQTFGSASNRDLSELREWLKRTLGEYGDSNPLIIRPNGDTRQERVIDVLNACAAAKVKNLTFG